MRFFGNYIDELPRNLNWKETAIILVTGDRPNFCGHVLLYVGGGFGHYFHFTGPHPIERPRYIPGTEWSRYISDNKKKEYIRVPVSIPHPDKAEAKLRSYIGKPWTTFLFHHNCATFAESIIGAGGNFWSFRTECPLIGIALKVSPHLWH